MIHPSAIVSKKANIAHDVEIGAYAIVEDDVEVEEGSRIAAHAILRNGARLGKNVTVDSFTTVAGLPQDLGFDPATPSFASIGNETTIREGSTINRATAEGGATSVGKNCFLMAVTHLGHDCVIGDRVVIGNNSLLGGFVTVGDNAFLGGASGIHQFCRIGEGVMFGGDSTATVDVPPFTTLAERNTLFGLNLVGLKRRGHSKDAINALKHCYREVMNAERLKNVVSSLLESDYGQFEETRKFLTFFKEGKRGFARQRRVR